MAFLPVENEDESTDAQELEQVESSRMGYVALISFQLVPVKDLIV